MKRSTLTREYQLGLTECKPHVWSRGADGNESCERCHAQCTRDKAGKMISFTSGVLIELPRSN